ncbi:MAG: transglutaminase domain-containing protein, partial [Oscillospiraceae bacterium]
YKKVRIAAFVLAAFILAGCNNGSDNSSVPVYSSTEESSSVSTNSTNSTSASNSTASTGSSVENSSGNSTNSTSSTSSSVEASSESSTAEEKPAVKTGVFAVTHDPQSDIKIAFDGLRVTVTGKIPPEGIDYVNTDRDADIKVTTVGNEFTVTIDYRSGADGFTTFRIFEKSGSRAWYRVKFADGKVCLPDCSDVSEKNTNVTEKAVEQPLEQVSEYVVIGSDKQAVREILLTVKNLSDEICAGLSSDYDKLRAIENWVANNIYYDYPAFNRGVPEETITLKYVLENKSTVCGGYSNITAALAAAQGIEIYNVHGTGAEGGFCFEENPSEATHEFNFAVIDGRVIWLDSDFDSRCYYYASGSYETGKAVRKFFDIDVDQLSLTHRAKYAEHRDYFALLDES